MKTLTFIIALAGFILSLSQWIYVLYSKRTNFNVTIENVEKADSRHIYTFTFIIKNLSSAPLVITRTSINNVNCLLLPCWIGERYYPKYEETDIPVTERVFSSGMPLNIPSNSSVIHTIAFKIPSDTDFILENPATVLFSTDKTEKEFTLSHPKVKPLLENGPVI